MDDPNVVPLRATPRAEASEAGQARRRRPSGVDALAAGAARASGERAKRRSTPLIGDPADNGAPPVKAHRPRPVAKPRPVTAADGKA
ncbi:MAG TPA: hypothetical protein VF825_09645, partial [Oryzihumus sp.]